MTGGAPRERAEIIVLPTGCVDVVIGTLSSGQGHETIFAQLVCEWLHVPFDSVRLVTGDTDRVNVGGGSHAGRSARFASIVIARASGELLARARSIAAALFECDEAEVQFGQAGFTKKNTDRVISLFELAGAAAERSDLAAGLRGSLDGVGDETRKAGAFPYGAQVCEVEVDPETGTVRLVNVVAVDDVGRARRVFLTPVELDEEPAGAASRFLDSWI